MHQGDSHQADGLARLFRSDAEMDAGIIYSTKSQAQIKVGGHVTPWRAVCRQWRVMMRSSRVSMFHQDVSDVLAAMQVEHQMEFLAEDGIFSVDVAIVQAEKKTAVEVDGPYHYTLNTHQPLGHTLLRWAALTWLCSHAEGWDGAAVVA